jgi:transcriptional regulator with XRE-family HTH domain
MSFGELVKELRIVQQKTLRQFCQEHGLDPSNWSKIERDVNPPPRDESTLAKWAGLLGLAPATDAWRDFMYQAEISRGNIPREVMSDKGLLAKLPVFLRTVRGAELTEAQLDDFIAKVREAHTPDKP